MLSCISFELQAGDLGHCEHYNFDRGACWFRSLVDTACDFDLFAALAILAVHNINIAVLLCPKQRLVRLVNKVSNTAIISDKDDNKSSRAWTLIKGFLILQTLFQTLLQKINLLLVYCMCYWAVQLNFRKNGKHLGQGDLVCSIYTYTAECLHHLKCFWNIVEFLSHNINLLDLTGSF